jgi:hypothetical protein
VTAASSVALVCPCNCFACSRSWVSVGIDQDTDSGSRQSLSAGRLVDGGFGIEPDGEVW